jgi:hypothetical protein
MTHHLTVGRTAASLTIISFRDPAKLWCPDQKNDNPVLEDLDFVQQAEIFEWVRERSGRCRR